MPSPSRFEIDSFMSSTSNRKLYNQTLKPQTHRSKSRFPSLEFRNNIPRRRISYQLPNIDERNFFGMGEIIAVLTNVKFEFSMLLA